ncbi:circadian clock KaiB family protein [Myxococcota bacterium]|nr:circadian clock KaiB family protein [Myxococcota bacterium]
MSEPSSKVIFKLYVTGQTVRSRIALENLRRICAERLGGAAEIEVIDVLERPELAEQQWIIATPTLVRELPAPSRRLVGDLSSVERVAEALGLSR